MADPKKQKKAAKLAIEVLSSDEVRLLIRSCSRRAPTGIRNAALICLLYRSGLRIGAALALRVKDVDIERCTIRVLHGKGDKARTVGLDETACSLLCRWLDKRQQLGLTARQPIFCTITDRAGAGGSQKGTEISQDYVRGLLSRLRRKAQIEKRVHAHGFRHTHAAELANEGVPVHVIQQQLGHSNVAITSRYINHLAPTQVIEAVKNRPAPW